MTIVHLDRDAYLDTGFHFVPAYYAREAARFAGQAWTAFCADPPQAREWTLAHFLANSIFKAHSEDAATLQRERMMHEERAKAGQHGR